jgi:dynein heavy chain
MESLCGSGGGWTRIANFDMSDATQSCPSGFRTYSSSGVRSCGRIVTNTGSCARSLIFPTNGIGYTEICGRVTGYQHGSTDASLADHGQTREHVWTFISGLKDSSHASSNCPCNIPAPGNAQNLGSFINGNYFCESGNPNTYNTLTTYFTADPLWDGQGCGSQESVCCDAAGLPWFHRQWNITSSESLEMRVRGTEGTNTEDVSIGYYEIYIK